MSSRKAKQHAMLFEYGTTYKTAYHGERARKAGGLPATTHLTKPQEAEPVTEILKDIHTMGQWKTRVPFSLWHRPKDIVRTNPYQHFNPYVFQMASQEEERKKAQKTRPRLLITPAVSIDDLDDDQRQNMIKQIYKTTSERFLTSAVPENPASLAPLPGTLAPSRPMKFPMSRPLYVPPEWRMDSAAWDRRQVRADCEATKEFWLNRPEPSCTPCKQSAAMRAYRQSKIL